MHHLATIIRTMKHGNTMLWGHSCRAETGTLATVEGHMNRVKYIELLKEKHVL